MNLYVVYDKIAKESGAVHENKNDAVALRNYEIFISEQKNIKRDEFAIYRVGTFDHVTMAITAEEPIEVKPRLELVDQLEED